MADLNYKHLRYFHAVAHEGHLTRAAAALNLSQSALSVQIRTLEDQLGHALFERRGKQLVLTEAGRVALDYANTIFATGDELKMVLGSRSGKAKQVLRIGALATLSRNFQMRFLKPLAGRVDVDIILRAGAYNDLLEALAGLELDVVLANLAPQRDTMGPFISHPIADQPVSLVGHPDKMQVGRSLADYLAGEPLIVPGHSSSIRTGFDALTARLGIRPNIVAEIDDMAMMRLLAREGFGLAVVPPIVVIDELAAGDLVDISALDGLKETFYAITVERRFANPVLVNLLARAAFTTDCQHPLT